MLLMQNNIGIGMIATFMKCGNKFKKENAKWSNFLDAKIQMFECKVQCNYLFGRFTVLLLEKLDIMLI